MDYPAGCEVYGREKAASVQPWVTPKSRPPAQMRLPAVLPPMPSAPDLEPGNGRHLKMTSTPDIISCTNAALPITSQIASRFTDVHRA